MKNKTNKKTIKKIKSVVRGAAKETEILIKKADKQAGKMVKILQKKWKKSEPQRNKYKEEIEVAAKRAGKKGVKFLKRSIKDGLKISGDVTEVIKKDIKEMRNRK